MTSNYEDIIKRGIIEPEELDRLIESEASDIKILDASFYLPTSDENALENYEKEHIPGAVFFDIKAIADKASSLPHMLPSPEDFETAVSQLGISNNDLVVVYGQSGMLMGPARVWWMFRVFGHDRVCVLNGGLPAWKSDGFETTDNIAETAAGTFKASFRPELVKNMQEALQESKSQSPRILDARPAERFSGESAEPRAGMRSGHIPGSINIPCSSLVDSQSGKFKTANDIEKIFKNKALDKGKPVLASCGSGITACVLALGLYHLGYPDVAVYDGSWSEWGREDSDTPIQTS